MIVALPFEAMRRIADDGGFASFAGLRSVLSAFSPDA